MNTHKLTRRSFLKSSAILASATLLPSFSIIKKIKTDDRLNVALIGCNSMGWANLKDFLANKNVVCIGLCDIDENVLNKRSNDLEQRFGQKATLYRDYRLMLENRDIDAVIIGTPDHWHCLQFVDAIRAGKDVYCEKPLANSIAECDAMTAIAASSAQVVQIGQQQRSSLLWKEMIDYLHAGYLGTISRVKIWANFSYAALPKQPDAPAPSGVNYNFWLGPAQTRPFNPNRYHAAWRMFWDYGGGLLTDWGVHLLDMGLWAMNMQAMPLETKAAGGKFLYPDGAHETPDTLTVEYRFPDFIMEWENNGGSDAAYFGKNYGLMFQGSNGRLVANREGWEVYPERQRTPAESLRPTDNEHLAHVQNFIECVKSRNKHTACTVENASLCAKYAHLGNISARTGMSLVYDDTKHEFEQTAANRFLKPEYLNGWTFPS